VSEYKGVEVHGSPTKRNLETRRNIMHIDIVKFDGKMYMREPEFILRVNGNSSMLCQTEEDCRYDNAVTEFSTLLVELVKVYPAFDGENFNYEHPIKIVVKSNLRSIGETA